MLNNAYIWAAAAIRRPSQTKRVCCLAKKGLFYKPRNGSCTNSSAPPPSCRDGLQRGLGMGRVCNCASGWLTSWQLVAGSGLRGSSEP